MKVTFPVKLTENLTGTLNVSITVQRETRQQAQSNGIDPEEMENIIYQKLSEIATDLGGLLGVDVEV